MRRLFKKLLWIAPPLVILPIASCSKKISETNVIEIVSDIADITVMQEEGHLSAPIQAKCFGRDRKEKEMDIKLTLKANDNDPLPNWIYMTENNEIMLKGGKDVGSYTFSVLAFNEEQQLYSTPKSFAVNVVEERHIIPTNLKLDIEDNKYCMFGETTSLNITVTPSKEGVEEKYLIKSCDFEVKVLEGLSTDLNGKPLFKFTDSNIDPELIVSCATNETYSGTYKLQITASLLANPLVKVSKQITINIANIRCYYDKESMYTYTRNNADEDWTLSKVDPSIRTLTKFKTFIQNKPVSKIGDYLCAKSDITNIVQIILPDSITTIGEHAFENQKYLVSMAIPGIKNVGNYAFYGDSILEYRTGSEKPSIQTIGKYAFAGCSMLKLDDQIEINEFCDFAFINAGLTEFKIGENCTYIGQNCFAGCNKLNSFKIYAKTPPILGGGTFSGCDQLKTIRVPAESLPLYKSQSSWTSLSQNIEGI